MSKLISSKNSVHYYLIAIIIAFTSCQKDNNNTPPVSESDLVKAEKTVDALADRDTANLKNYISQISFKQHNPDIADGIDGLFEAINNGYFDNTSIDIKRKISGDKLVAFHSLYNLDGTETVSFDVFKFEDNLIVEHWENKQLLSEPNLSGRSMLDGTIEKTDAELSETNRQHVQQYIEDIMVQKKLENLPSYIDTTNFIQHSPLMGDGYQGMLEGMNQMESEGHSYKYDKIHQVIADGNFVLVLSEGIFGPDQDHTAFYDLYRLDNNLIVEHWDVIESIPQEDQWKHNNGKF